MTDRKSNVDEPVDPSASPSPPDDTGEPDTAEPTPARAPVHSLRERQSLPPGAPPVGSYPGPAGGPGPDADRPAPPPDAHRADEEAQDRATPTLQERTTPTPPPQREDLTVVVDRRNFPPPPMRDATNPWMNREAAPPRPPVPGRPTGEAPAPPWAGAPYPPPPGGDQPGPQWPEAAPAHPPGPGRWADQQPAGEPAAMSPANWSYVDQIRSSELVPTRRVPPGRGWRRAIYRGTFGLINLGQSPDERRLAELEVKIRSLLRGHYKIGVLGKGGTGKTTIAAAVGSIFAEIRQEDRVVAIDADTGFGKLGSRIDPHVAGSYWELVADQYLYTFADVRSRVGNNAAGLFVLAGEAATARRRILDPAIYREATARLDHHFTISIVDCGSTMDSPVTQEALRDLDALIVVSSPWVDGASAAGQTMEWLANSGFTGLLHRTVVVLNDSDGHADKRTRALLAEQFGSRGQKVVEVPFDTHLRPGGVIDVDNEIDRTTRRRLIEIAAAIAEHFPATTDGPRERR